MNLCIRQSTEQDADAIGRLAAEFQSYLRSLGDKTEFDWGAAKYLRDGFGADRAFEGIVAEVDSRVIGYALYHFGYDTDHGQRFVFMIDLYVTPSLRRAGIGEQLMGRIAEIGRSKGSECIVWSVAKSNVVATRFYEKLGATYLDEQRFMQMSIPLTTA